MNLKMDGAAEPLGFKVLLVQMFKAALSYLRSFSKVFPYPLGSCEKKMLISHSLLTTSLPDPASTIHLLVASRKRSIGKCVPGRCWHVQGLLLPTTKPHSELAIAVQSSQVQGSSGCVHAHPKTMWRDSAFSAWAAAGEAMFADSWPGRSAGVICVLCFKILLLLPLLLALLLTVSFEYFYTS